MVEAIVSSLPFRNSDAIRVIDLGCGTGTAAARVLSAFPNAHMTCLDVAENMIAVAQAKLGAYPQVKWVVGDFDAVESRGPFDAVVSSLALHHLPSDSDKRDFFGRVRARLRPGGAFYNGDVVLGSTEFLQSVNMANWRTFMRRSVPEADIDGNWIPRYYAEDRPAQLVKQLDWLQQAGFVGVDVVWKRSNFAVYGGVAPNSFA